MRKTFSGIVRKPEMSIEEEAALPLMCPTAPCPTGDLTIVSSPVKVRIPYVLGEKSKHPWVGPKLVGFDKRAEYSFLRKGS
jgi:hypothetical protein